ncbi:MULTISPECIES: type II toxin-antitoxin system HicB family antitoxin [Herbaspirillum]|uniref:type II toxin-antitoxin system HicB family antitoxin n=1 Tax=Herbaspirillum TaxID=963 RepID=UPI001F5165C8|nr:type II toxin-antitoxin system HicB family antitoxin [Herbaspirillum sp. C7C2]MCI1014324.1 type II toxin-antitoxin system HicB family antitoxin [Herbaspirillum sp. C7C2]
MLYPIYVHKDPDSAYGAQFPDFPGCFAGADDLQDLLAAAREAAAAHFHGETEPIPLPSTPEDWSEDAQFQGGYWMLMEIELSPLPIPPNIPQSSR